MAKKGLKGHPLQEENPLALIINLAMLNAGRKTQDAKRLRAQPSKRTDTNPWLLYRTQINHCTSVTTEQEFGEGRVPWMAHYSCVARRWMFYLSNPRGIAKRG